MAADAFDEMEQAIRQHGPEAGFQFLKDRFRREKDYHLLFEATLMNKRRELGLPLIQTESAATFPEDKQQAFDRCFLEAGREAGELFLADGNIERAFPYFRAIGDTAPIASAIEQVKPGEGIEPVIQIAYNEGVHPFKGFELILAQYGMCRAITSFQMYPVRTGREQCIALLVRALHAEVADSLKQTISRNEGKAPETDSLPELVAGRDWLFGEYAYYADTSHVVSVIRYSTETGDRRTLELAAELCEYGKHLSGEFQYRSDPPFEDVYNDHGAYLQALLGRDVEDALSHFRKKVVESDPDQAGTLPAQALVGLLVRLGRYEEAIDVSVAHLNDMSPAQLGCPSVLQLCHLAGDYRRLKSVARSKGDLLSYAAAAMQREAPESG